MTEGINLSTATHINVGGTWHRIYGGALLIDATLHNNHTEGIPLGHCIHFQAHGGETITAPITHVWAIRHRPTERTTP